MCAKILVLSAKAGAGHIIAAAGLEQAFNALDPKLTVVNKDCLEYTPRPFARIYSGGYHFLSSRCPAQWGRFFRAFDSETRDGGSVRRLGMKLQAMASGRMAERIEEEGADAVVVTHFFPPQAVGAVERSYPLYVVVTDYVLHPVWINTTVRRYFVGAKFTKNSMIARGVDGKLITVTGLPLRAMFANPPSRSAARKAMNVPDDTLGVLVVAGGAGVGSMLEIARMAASVHRPMTLITVTGTNEAEKRKLSEYRWPGHVRHVGLGFVEDMATVMACSDVVITKSGGLSVAEALALGLPMVITKPVPGQEEGNAQWLGAEGAALVAATRRDLARHIKRLILDGALREKIAAAASGIGSPAASAEIASHVLKDIRGS